MDYAIDITDDNLTLIWKRIQFLKREVRATGDSDARRQLVSAYHNFGVVMAQELTHMALRDMERAMAVVNN